MGSVPIYPLHFACAGIYVCRMMSRMAAKRSEEPGSRTAAYRNLLKSEDLTMKMVRRRTPFGLVAAIAALALAGWLLSYFA
jgi:hypothetical protein